MDSPFVHPGPISFFFPVRSSLLNDSRFLGAVPPLFENIQICNPIIPAGEFFLDFTINYVDLSRAIIHWNGFITGGNNPQCFPRCFFTSPTNVRCQRGYAVADQGTQLQFNVVELSSSLVKSLQAFEITIPDEQSFLDITIDELVVLKSLIYYCGFSIGVSTWDLPSLSVKHYFIDSTTIRAYRSGTNYDSTSNIIVIETY